MTDHFRYPSPGEPRPRKRHRVLYGVVAIIAGLFLIAIVAAVAGNGDQAYDSQGHTGPAARVVADATSPTTRAAARTEVTAADYAVTVKIKKKQCFGTAGCIVSADLKLTARTLAAQDVAADITVRVTGDESGPITETLEADGDGGYSAPTVDLSTPGSSTKVRATITDVQETGR